MNFLDDPRNFKNIDPENLYDPLSKFGRQFESGWNAAEFASLNFDVDKIKNIVFCGMGGSNLAAKVALSLSPFLLKLPFEIVANYRLPGYADKNTLVILSSYSGNTEETLSCFQDALMRGCMAISITTGGKLRNLAVSKNVPLIELDEKFNSLHVPRAGICLSLGAVLGLLVRINPLAKKYFVQKDITQTLERVQDMVNIHKDSSENPAKALAGKHKGLGIIFFSANHLTGTGSVLVNFLNETAKTFATSFEFPDLNHHLLEGFSYPTSLKDDIGIILLNSRNFPEIIQKRIQITREILVKQKYRLTLIKPESTDPVLEVFESLAFLIMFSYYLSIVNKTDPSTNPWVDYLKKELH